MCVSVVRAEEEKNRDASVMIDEERGYLVWKDVC